MRKIEILDAKGSPIILNEREKLISLNVGRQIENAGYEIDVTTLTTIMKQIVEQKFFQVPFADYCPVKVGEGAWSAALTTYRSFDLGDDFSTGVINTGSNQSRMASSDVSVDSVSVPVFNWAKTLGWTLFDLQLASKSGNWDIVTAKEKSRKRNWDLGLQKLIFLGLKGNTVNCPGLLNQSDVTIDTTTIPKFINAQTAAEFQIMVAAIYQSYRANCNYTAQPTHFIIPEADYNGLTAYIDVNFPIKTKLQALRELFIELTMNSNFKILPLAYANKAIQGSVNTYTLLNYDEDSVRIDIPVNYTNTLANSTDNFNFQNVGYGQFSGVKAYRPKEMLYFTHAV